MRRAARDLVALGARAVLLKGGRLDGQALDVFFDGDRLVDLPAERIDTRNTQGTGCTLSAAIAARLALGDDLLEAVTGAKAWLTVALRGAYSVGHGRGPVDHLGAPVPPRGGAGGRPAQ